MKPVVQKQPYNGPLLAPLVVTQEAPFWQGFGEQLVGATSVSQSVPVYPFKSVSDKKIKKLWLDYL